MSVSGNRRRGRPGTRAGATLGLVWHDRAVTGTPSPRIIWSFDTEHRRPFGPVAPDPGWADPIGFPPPWPDRPWVFGVMVASADGVVSWRRRDAADDPALTILGGDETRPERVADRRLVRLLRCFGDVGVGAGTLREQPGLVPLPREPGEPPVPALHRFRAAHGLSHDPRVVVYSLRGRLPLDQPVFHTPGVETIVVTSPAGAAEIGRAGPSPAGLAAVVEALPDPEALRRAHRRLAVQHGVRYLACEGGMTLLRSLRAADLLDEMFLTTTDVRVGPGAADGVETIPDFAGEGARLVAEGQVEPAGRWRFRRWRLHAR